MNYKFKTLAKGKNWIIQWKRIQGEESVSLTFDNDTVVDCEVLDAIRKHGAWHLYCANLWAGGDLSVFKPVAEIVERISLSTEKNVKIVGLDCLVNLTAVEVGGDVSQVDFTKFTRLCSLFVNEVDPLAFSHHKRKMQGR